MKDVTKLVIVIIGMLITIPGWVLCFRWFDWKLALVLFLILWGNNITNNYRK